MEQRHVNEIREIIYQARQGESIHGISHGLCLARNTVRKYLRLAENEGFLKQRPAFAGYPNLRPDFRSAPSSPAHA